MLLGEYDHSTDAKGRLFVPSKFRDEFGETIVVTKGPEGCLYAYGETEWKRLVDQIRDLPLSDAEGREFERFFFAGAAELEIDKQGRILIPAKLREYADIEKDVISVGVVTRMEIWDKRSYEAREIDSAKASDIIKNLNDSGIKFRF